MTDWSLYRGLQMRRIALIIIFALNVFGHLAYSQDDQSILTAPDTKEDVSEVDMIEAELQKSRDKKKDPAAAAKNSASGEGLSSLVDLAPFSDVSVIQKRYMPKTGRFQIFGGLIGIVNDPWFTSLGLSLKLGYHFTEVWGIDLNYINLNTSERVAAKELYSEHAVAPSSLVTVKSYSGADLTWTPIYGKISLSNHRIIPFDMYFAAGPGVSKVENGTGGSTFHAGTGQIFVLSKSQAFRWDFSWNFMNAQPTGRPAQNFNNLSLTIGYSLFFPEANYR